MTRPPLWHTYIRWHTLRTFFEGYEPWTAFCAASGKTDPMTKQAYSDYLWGTDASIYIPLWASVCKRPGSALLDETTRDVIAFYKMNGYSHVEMDGNPPDYIGQQCRFLEYLSVCAIKGCDTSAQVQDFLFSYFADTVHAIILAAQKYPLPKTLQWILKQLSDGICQAPWPYPELDWQHFDSFSWAPHAPIALSAPFTTTHASFADCGRKCKMIATVQEGCILSIAADTNFPHKKFVGCARGRQYRQSFLSPHRLRYPMLRIGARGEGHFRRLSWEEAAAYVANALRDTQKKYGPASRYVMPASGVNALLRGDRFAKNLLALNGGYLDFYNYYSAACAEHALPYVFGTDVCGSSEEEMWKTKLLILWGHNPANTIWGDAFLPNLAKAKRSGVRIVVIDPRYSETAMQYADQWIGILPSTDGALCDALAYEIWSRSLQDQAFMDRFCLGFDEAHMPPGVPAKACYRAYLFGEVDGIIKNAKWAEPITGVPAKTIQELAIAYATTKPACLMPGLGPQRTLSGEQNCRAFAALACLTGNVGISGGGSGGYPNKPGHAIPDYPLLPNPYPGKIPSFLWPKAAAHWQALHPEDGLKGIGQLSSGIKLIFNLASGMLLNQHSNINETAAILKQHGMIEHVILSDLFMTPGARFADLLLPGVSFFEAENIVPPWNSSDYLLYNQQAIQPLFGGQFEYDWIQNTAQMLGCQEALCHNRSAQEWLSLLYSHHREIEPKLPAFSDFCASGCYVYRHTPYHIAFQRQIAQGVPFQTPSGKIEIFSQRLYEKGNAALPGIPSYTPCAEGVSDPLRSEFPLLLIGFHTNRRCHSLYDNNPQLDELEQPALWIHPTDAQDRGIVSGDLVEIFNSRGRIRIPAKVTTRIVPSCVALSEGGWYTPDSDGVDTRGSINVLTMTHHATPLAKANPQHTNLVQVTACTCHQQMTGA